MPDWFKLYRTFSSNSKIQRLRQSVCTSVVREDALNDVLVQGMMVRLWLWCNDRTTYIKKTKQREGSVNNGYIFAASKINDAEYAIGWSGEPGGFINACIECGLIDDLGGENGEHDYQIHNWERYAGALMDAMRKRVEGRNQYTVQDNPGTSVTIHEHPASSILFSSSLLSSSITNDHISNDHITRSSSPDMPRQDMASLDMPKPLPRLDMDDSIQAIFQHYKGHHPKSSVARLQVLSDEYRCIAAMLESGFTVEDCCRAIDGYHNSAFHLGANDNNQKYLALTLIFQDVSHVQKGVEMADSSLESSLLTASEVKEKLKREVLVRRVEERKAKKLPEAARGDSDG